MLVALFCVGLLVSAFSQVSAEDTKKITWFHYETDPRQFEMLAEIVKTYEQLNPGVKVQQQVVAEEESGEKIGMMMMAGDIPEVVEAKSEDTVNWARENYLLPLDEIVDYYGDFISGGLKMNSYEGTVYGLPRSAGLQMMYYRKDLYKEQGLAVPQTWEEGIAAAKKLSVDADGDGVIDTYGIGLPVSRETQTQEVFIQFLWQQDETLFDANHDFNLANPGPAQTAEKVLEYYRSLAKYNPPGASAWNYTDFNLAFAAGKFAAAPLYGRLLLYLERYAPNLSGKTSAYLLPAGKKRAACVWAESFTVFKDSKYPEEGKKFLKFFYSNDIYREFLLTMPILMLPWREGVMKDPEFLNDPMNLKFADALNSTLDAVQYGYNITLEFWDEANPNLGPVWGSRALTDMVQRVVIKGIDPAIAIQWAVDQVKGILGG